MEIASLAGNVEEFPILGKWTFFNHAGVAPIPRRCAMAMVKYAGQAAEDAYIDTDWYKQIESLRKAVANLINADRTEIAFVKNTSEGLSLVANGLTWQSGDRVVTTAVEYPANAYPWIDLQQRKGIDLVRVAEEQDAAGVRQVPIDNILKAADHPRTRLITLSHVEFGTGQRHDLTRIGEFCHQRDIRLCVDGIQSVGVLPVDVRAMHIDYLSADGHKWLLGPEGAGFFYCRKELVTQTHPALIGWLNVEKPLDFDHINFVLKSDAGRFECGTHNIPGLLGLRASIDLIASVGIDAIAARVGMLTDKLASGLQERGFTVASPRQNEQWSGIVSFSKPGLDHQKAALQLRKEHHIELAVRHGRLRCSPHFYNTPEEIEKLLGVIG